jgi:hypothetical protein
VIAVCPNLFPYNDLRKSREEAYSWLYHREKGLSDIDETFPEKDSLRHLRFKNGQWEIQLLLLLNCANHDFKKDDPLFFEQCDPYLLEGTDKDEVTKGRPLEAKIFKKRYGISKLKYARNITGNLKTDSFNKIKLLSTKIFKRIATKK